MASALIVLLVLATVVGTAYVILHSLKVKVTQTAEMMSRLARTGRDTTGHITDMERKRRSRGEFENFVTYTFEAENGIQYSKTLRVTARFDEFEIGQPIEVTYLPDDPEVNATKAMVDKVRYAKGAV